MKELKKESTVIIHADFPKFLTLDGEEISYHGEKEEEEKGA